jgi:hypothetical protein
VEFRLIVRGWSVVGLEWSVEALNAAIADYATPKNRFLLVSGLS